MTDKTPQAVQACHALLVWVVPQLDKFPRVRRFTLGERKPRLVSAAPFRDRVVHHALLNLIESPFDRNDNGHRFARKLRGFVRDYAARRLDWDDFNLVVQSWIGHADTLGLRRTIFSAIPFGRGSGQEAAGA